jgi:hypothetical protein
VLYFLVHAALAVIVRETVLIVNEIDRNVDNVGTNVVLNVSGLRQKRS